MAAVRIMTYNIRCCRGCDGRVEPDRILEVIDAVAPDIVALQEVDAGSPSSSPERLARSLGMTAYGGRQPGGNAFLSFYPLKWVREYQLGDGGGCLRAEAELGERRLLLVNLRLAAAPVRRRRQINALFDAGLVGNQTTFPTLLLGDFADCLWAPGNLALELGLEKVRSPWWRGTWPARIPLAGRDRAYIRGGVEVLEARIDRSARARQASSHLPLTLTVDICDPRCYLKVENVKPKRMEIAPG